jgi:hypothetical protein
MRNALPTVRPSQRIRNVAHAMRLEARGEDYPTNADLLDEIANSAANLEEWQAATVDYVTALESLIAGYVQAHDTDEIALDECECDLCQQARPLLKVQS